MVPKDSKQSGEVMWSSGLGYSIGCYTNLDLKSHLSFAGILGKSLTLFFQYRNNRVPERLDGEISETLFINNPNYRMCSTTEQMLFIRDLCFH